MDETKILLISLVLLFTLGYTVLLFYFLKIRKGIQLPSIPTPVDSASLPEITVILPVRNEIKNIPNVLKCLLNQDYPKEKTKIIFVNDHSDDGSLEFLKNINEARIKILDLDQSQGKKAALSEGIQAAQTEWILTTDADCFLPENWITTLITEGIYKKAVMVTGMVRIIQEDNFFSWFQMMEGAVLQICGSASLALKKPLLNTGASLAFRKSAWLAVGGYSSNDQIASGDDTFLMLSLNKKFPGEVIPCMQPGALVSTRPASTLKELFHQRSRWAGKTKHYGSVYINVVGLIIITAALAYLLCFIGGFVNHSLFLIWILLAAIRGSAELSLLDTFVKSYGPGVISPDSQTINNTEVRRIPLFVPVFMVLIYPIFTLAVILLSAFRATSWKGRKL